MKKIKGVFVRHGVSAANKDKMLVGSTDVELSEDGIEKLLEIKEENIFPKTDVYFSSDLKRAVKTSEILFDKKQPILNKNFRELHFGALEKKYFADIDIVQIFKDWYEDDVVCDAETYTDFSKRIIFALYELLDDLVKRDASSFTLTSHSCTMRMIKSHLQNIDKYNFLDIRIKNGHGFIAQINYDEIGKKIHSATLTDI